jgi:hypothetical protein
MWTRDLDFSSTAEFVVAVLLVLAMALAAFA